MFSLFETRSLAINLRNWVFQINWIKLITAVIALIAASAVCTTDWAGSFDIAVWQGATGRWRNSHHLRTLVNVAIF